MARSKSRNIADLVQGRGNLTLNSNNISAHFTDIDFLGTGSITLPSGTTAQRDGSPAVGMIRFNTTLGVFEGYKAGSWSEIGGGSSDTWTTDNFTGNGSTAAYTLTQAPASEDNVIAFIEGVFQNPADFVVNGTTITFDENIPTGQKVVVHTVKATVAGNNLNQDAFTGDGSTTAFTLSINPIDERNTMVYIDGVYQNKSTYSLANQVLHFSTAPDASAAIEVLTFTQTTINAPTSNSVSTTSLIDDSVTSPKLGHALTLQGNTVFNGSIQTENISIPDNYALRLGSSQDLQIYHTGGFSVIKDAGTGDLEIQTNGSEIQLTGNAGTDYMARFISNGAVKLYHDNVLTFETTSTGVTANGTVTATTFSGDLNGTINTATAATTQANGVANTTISTTAYVTNKVAEGKISPTFTGTPSAPTAANTVSTTQLATTAHVTNKITQGTISPTFTGTPAAPTAANTVNSTQLATTAFVSNKITELIGGAPSTLNDLNELAAAINDDANYNSTLTTALATKLPLAGGTMTGHLNGTSFGSGISATVGISGTPADLNSADLGPGYLTLARDDTADAAQIRFGKNGSVHSYLETRSTGLGFVTDVGDFSFEGGYVGIGRTPGVELDIKRTSNATPLRVGSDGGQGRAMVFADVLASPTKYNWLAGAQYNTDNAYEITPSTAIGGYTFSNPAITILQNGHVGIGMSTALNSKFNVFGDGEVFRVDGSPNTSRSIRFRNCGTNGSANAILVSDGTLQLKNEDANAAMYFNSVRNMEFQVTSGNGTAGDFTFLSYNTEIMRLDGATNNVGIGDNNPGAKLRVVGLASSVNLGGGSVNSAALYVNAASGHNGELVQIIDKNNVEQLHISNGGNVGIGVASPNNKLEVNGHIAFSKNGTSGNRYLLIEGADATYAGTLNIQAGFGSTAAGGAVKLYAQAHATYPGSVWIGRGAGAAGDIMFGNGGTGPSSASQIQMALTSGGDLLIGNSTVQPSSNHNNQTGFGYDTDKGQLQIASTTDNAQMELSRNSSNDGNWLTFRKQGNILGNIGTYGGTLYIGSVGGGIMFNGTDIEPTTGGASRTNNSISLGSSNYYFHDGYFGGKLSAGVIKSGQYEWGSSHSIFGQDRYRIRELNNLFYGATYRYGGYGSSSANLSASMFNGNFDSGLTLATNTTHVFEIDTGSTFTYPAGAHYISFYHVYNQFASIKVEQYHVAGTYSGQWVLCGTATDFRGSAGSGGRVVEIGGAGNNYTSKYRLTIVTNSNSVVVTDWAHYMTRSAGYDVNQFFKKDEEAQLTRNIIFRNSAQTQVGSIVVGNSTAYNTTSDYRLKENVAPITSAAAKVQQLKPIKFNFIEDETNTLIDGFLAHEVASVVPQAVTGVKDAVTPDDLYLESDPLPDGVSIGDVKVAGGAINPQQLDYTKLIPILTAALQEALDRIEVLENQ